MIILKFRKNTNVLDYKFIIIRILVFIFVTNVLTLIY